LGDDSRQLNPSAGVENQNWAGPSRMRERPKREPAGVKILQEGKSDQQLRPTIRTKIKAMNTRKISDLVPTQARCKLEIFH
jgi:hypothetical protein